MKLSEIAVTRPVTMVMIAICMVVLGVVSLSRLPLEQLPAISSSGITVSADYPSSSPEEVERLIARPLEETLATMGNVDRINATSSRNGASVRVDFVAGTDMDLANMEIREYVDRARGLLPADLDRLRIRRWQSDQRPILYISMAWRGGGDRLLDIVTKVVEPRLLRIDGVANVTVRGVQEKQLIVELNQKQLETHDVALPALGRQLQANNINVSIGRIRDGDQRYLARALGEFTQTDEIGKLPVRGGAFRLEDLGEVKYDYPEKRSFDRLNGVDAVTVQVYKSSAANVVQVATQVRTTLAKIGDQYGSDLDVEIVRDRAKSVMDELNNLKDAAFLGAFLAVGIIYLFLRNIRSTLVIGIAIPTAALCVFTGMYVAREFFESTITLNMVSMMGLMLAVGMLVDPAVVCLESIFRRRQEEGQDAPGRDPHRKQRGGHGGVRFRADDDVRFYPLLFPVHRPRLHLDARRRNDHLSGDRRVHDRSPYPDSAGNLAPFSGQTCAAGSVDQESYRGSRIVVFGVETATGRLARQSGMGQCLGSPPGRHDRGHRLGFRGRPGSLAGDPWRASAPHAEKRHAAILCPPPGLDAAPSTDDTDGEYRTPG